LSFSFPLSPSPSLIWLISRRYTPTGFIINTQNTWKCQNVHRRQNSNNSVVQKKLQVSVIKDLYNVIFRNTISKHRTNKSRKITIYINKWIAIMSPNTLPTDEKTSLVSHLFHHLLMTVNLNH
jgi:hypothetical protein